MSDVTTAQVAKELGTQPTDKKESVDFGVKTYKILLNGVYTPCECFWIGILSENSKFTKKDMDNYNLIWKEQGSKIATFVKTTRYKNGQKQKNRTKYKYFVNEGGVYKIANEIDYASKVLETQLEMEGLAKDLLA